MTFRRPSATALLSLLLTGALVWLSLRLALSVYSPSPAAPAEFAWLARTYGPERHSEFIEEWVIRDVFQNRRGGTFLDVGAADFKEQNNTYFLETALDWSGIAIDAVDYAEGYRVGRPRTRFLRFFVSDRSDDVVDFYEMKRNNAASSGDKAFVDRFGETPTVRRVQTITLDRLLDAAGIPHVDFVSLDIELGEPKALAGFDIRRFRPSLVCVEAHTEVRQALLDYFARNGYVALGKYLRVDTRNLYFAPLDQARPAPFPPDVIAADTRGGY
jgi:hypothetical protein